MFPELIVVDHTHELDIANLMIMNEAMTTQNGTLQTQMSFVMA